MPTTLFVLKSLYYLRNFDSGFRELLRRGERVLVYAEPERILVSEIKEQRHALEAAFPDQITFHDTPRRRDFRHALDLALQGARTELHYREHRFDGTPGLRERASEGAGLVARLLHGRHFSGPPGRSKRRDAWLNAMQLAIPPSPDLVALLGNAQPDVVVVSPLVHFHSEQYDWLRAAAALGIPAILAVASWDNLTNKSRVQMPLDRIVLWNAAMREEALALHGIGETTIRVTGAAMYDEWFVRRPTRDRSKFLIELGLAPERPLVLYTGSSRSIAPDEPTFVRRWLVGLRAAADPRLASANVLIRPHPFNRDGFPALVTRDASPVAVYPSNGGIPVVERIKADYFDALFHANAVVGLNTSALVEAAILGRRSFTVRDPETRSGQEGTFHFHHLTGGGILQQAATLDLHFADLTAELAGQGSNVDLRGFVSTFLRPNGIERPAAPIFADALGEPFDSVRQPSRPSPIMRLAVDLFAIAVHTTTVASGFVRRVARGIARRLS